MRDGEIVSLTPKAFELLTVLVQRSGQLVEKEELMREVWPETFVEEGNLSVHIFALRKALGENGNGQSYIDTVPRQGYRFSAAVRKVNLNGAALIVEKHTQSLVTIEEHEESVEEKGALPKSQTIVRGAVKRRRYTQLALAASLLLVLAVGSFIYLQRNPKQTAAVQLRTIAVLPFKPLSPGADDEYFRTGMADALIIKLGGLRQIVVRPTSAVLRYTDSKEDSQAIGRALGVDAVLEGYIQRDGERIRATARLISVPDGGQLWAGRFDDSFTNVFAVQDSISAQVAHSLFPTLINDEKQALAKRYTDNTQAYLEYLKGRYFWNKRTAADAEKAIKHFEQAIALDPNYALAYSGLADCYAIRTGIPPAIAIPKAMSAALRAVELDDGIAEGHVSLGTIKELYEWDRSGAEREYKRAIELNPNYALAHGLYSLYLTSMGRFDESAAEAKRAQEIDPLSPSMYIYAGWNFYNARQYDRSIEEAQKALGLDPNVSMAYNIIVRASAEKKMFEDAIAAGQRAKELSAEKGSLMSKEYPLSLASLGYAYAVSGQPYEARQILAELRDLSSKGYISPNHFAVVHAGLGEKDQALEYLEKTYQERDEMQRFIKVSPIFDNLHSDARFIDLLRRVGWPQ
jgi:DNA-binding winged helix-turn-helix (wHTH) protein/TolB-like protein/tetratricopeptide (TPR) repeat protein